MEVLDHENASQNQNTVKKQEELGVMFRKASSWNWCGHHQVGSLGQEED